MFSFTVNRRNNRRSNPTKIQAQLERIARAATRGARGQKQGWYVVNTIKSPKPNCVGDGFYEYSFTFQFDRKTRNTVSHEVSKKQFEVLMDMAQGAANLYKWNIVDFTSEGEQHTTSTPQDQPKVKVEFIEPAIMTPIKMDDHYINLDPSGYFDHLYDRESQINVLLSGSRTAIESDFKIRTHALFYGPAAGGKTSLTTAFINMVGEEHCYRIDATTSTQAGVLNDIIERGQFIKFLIIDEIEKCKEEQLRWLLSIMDERGELRVNNAKLGFVQKSLPAFVIATTNDIDKVERFMSGALHSRFSDRIHCPRIRDETIFRAVKKYIDMINGDDSWIYPAVKYVREVEKTDDIRRMIAVAVNGRERLVTGEYQRILQSSSV